MHNIANAFAEGRGVQQSDEKALLYYDAAAQAGDPYAAFTLGTWYYAGKGGLKANKEKAYEYNLAAAKMGHPNAMFNVGVALLIGEGTSKDKSNAILWLKKASDAQVVHATLNLAKVYMEDSSFEEAETLLSPLKDKNEVALLLLKEIEHKKSSIVPSSATVHADR